MNVGQDTSTGNRDSAQQLVEFFVILDGQGNVARDNTRLLVVAGGITGQFKDFGAQVFQNSRQIHGGAGSHTRGVLAGTQVTTDTTHGELQSSLDTGRSGLLLVTTATLALSFS